MAEQSLKDKTVKGTFWSAADSFLGQGVTFIVGLVLARLLSPEEYGLIGIVTIFINVMLGVVDSGFSNALIRKKDVTDDDYNTLFYFNLVVSILMCGLLYLGAPAIALFFNHPQLVTLTRVMGILLVFQSLSIVQYTILSRNIDFKTKTKASVVSAVISGIIGILMAYTGFGVWSLVAQQLSRQLLYTLCLWLLNKWWPKVRFSFKSFKYMWGFGWKLLLSGLLNNIWVEFYKVVVSKFYSPVTLGQYTRSEQFANIFSLNFTGIIQKVSYPVLAQVQNEKERLVNGFRRIIKTTTFVTVVIMFFMGAVAEPLIYCLIGPQWQQAASFLPLICIALSSYPLQVINLNMLQVQNRTDVFLYLEIVKKVLALGPICLGIFVNIYWMLIGSIILSFICIFLNSYYTGKKLGYTSLMQLKDISPSFAVAFVVGASVFFLKYLPISFWVVLPIQLILGAIVLIVLCELIRMPEYIEMKGIVLDYYRSFQLHISCKNTD